MVWYSGVSGASHCMSRRLSKKASRNLTGLGGGGICGNKPQRLSKNDRGNWAIHAQTCCAQQRLRARFGTCLLVVSLRELCSDELHSNVTLVLIHAAPIFRIYSFLHNVHAVLSPSGVQPIKLQTSVSFGARRVASTRSRSRHKSDRETFIKYALRRLPS